MCKDRASQEIVVYSGLDVERALPLDRVRETVWASSAQIEELFAIDQSGVSRHIRNIFRDAEVDQESNMQKVHIASADRPVTLYGLDVILAVGYRANSGRAILVENLAKIIRERMVASTQPSQSATQTGSGPSVSRRATQTRITSRLRNLDSRRIRRPESEADCLVEWGRESCAGQLRAVF
jgi:hypothetical protein